ncbi:MAG: AzlC family ABC transporter permease [Actinomycetota bacterium]|nr:AzlC family ABC transporter permease [Actinomycetota bacterium]
MFGVIYGSLIGPEIGATATMVSSLVIFSGSVQFTLAGYSPRVRVGALIAGAATLNLRNLVLGAVMRPRIAGGRQSERRWRGS